MAEHDPTQKQQTILAGKIFHTLAASLSHFFQYATNLAQSGTATSANSSIEAFMKPLDGLSELTTLALIPNAAISLLILTKRHLLGESENFRASDLVYGGQIVLAAGQIVWELLEKDGAKLWPLAENFINYPQLVDAAANLLPKLLS